MKKISGKGTTMSGPVRTTLTPVFGKGRGKGRKAKSGRGKSGR